MNCEMLIATMNNNNFDKYHNMNLSCDAIFANQADRNCFEETVINGNTVKMYTTSTRGVGINRNLALLMARADICILSDDDMKYSDDYVKEVVKAFEAIPDADVIIFNIETVGMDMNRRQNNDIKKVGLHNFMNYGAARVAFRRKSIENKSITFSHLFGGGCIYMSGEDTLFLRECLRKGLNMYTYPYTIASVEQFESTWFKGYNENYFYDKGALLKAAFPIIHPLMILLFAVKQKHLSFIKRISNMIAGALNFGNATSYKEYKERK